MRVLVVVMFSLMVATCGQKGPLLPPPQDAPPAAGLAAAVANAPVARPGR